MNETFRHLHGVAQAALLEAMEGASAALDRVTDEKNDWRAEVIRLRELLWHLCASGRPECPRCEATGRQSSSWLASPDGRTVPCPACKGHGWQAIGSLEEGGVFPLAQADHDNGWAPV